jgi:LPS-assembly lipoprotein
MKKLAVILSVLVWLAGCSGFHLRGSKPLPAIAQEGIYLQDVDLNSDFGIALRSGLEDAGVSIKKDADNVSTTLDLVSMKENTSVSGYSSTRQVREFNHMIDVTFRVTSKKLPEAVERSVHVERSQTYDGIYVLGTAEEEAVIKDELRQEAVRLILLRLQALAA